jgi:hypothetical protein
MPLANKPDPDGDNNNRARWARSALEAFKHEVGSSDDAEAIGDLLSDLRHLADRIDMPDEQRDYLFERAEEYYREETTE